jgi:leucyl aminopeptidase
MNETLAGLAATGGASLPLFGVRPTGLETLLARLPGADAQAGLSGFTAEPGQVLRLLDAALLGLGDGPALHGFGAAAAALPAGSVWHLAGEEFSHDDAALGFLLGAYRYDRFKLRTRGPALLAPENVSPRVLIIASSICLARDLINTPPNHLGPAELAQAALDLAARHGARAERVNSTDILARYPAVAVVGAGSARAPEVAVLHWEGSNAGANAPLISLCGKGVCFDTGGYDLKPSSAMLRMKKDMGGAAIVLGLGHAIMSLNLPVKLQIYIGCVENSISGHAMRPSDILQTRSGLTVEVGNTDAEGRLVLCDLLAEACSNNPDWLIDVATLTGAARAALGPDLPALFCTDEAMASTVLHAGEAAHDPLWRLPLFGAYDSWLDSNVADMNNVSTKPFAGAIIAALFLKRFVSKQVSWAHIDTYAWNDANRPGRPEGGEAQTLRALLDAIENFSAERQRNAPL